MFSAKSARAASMRAGARRAARRARRTTSTRPDGERRFRCGESRPPADRDRVAVAKLLEERGVGRLDQPDPGLGERERTGVRIAPGGERRDVDDGGDAGGREVLRGDPVEVRMVDDRDVGGTEASHQHLGAPPESRVPLDGRLRAWGTIAPSPEQAASTAAHRGLHRLDYPRRRRSMRPRAAPRSRAGSQACAAPAPPGARPAARECPAAFRSRGSWWARSR